MNIDSISKRVLDYASRNDVIFYHEIMEIIIDENPAFNKDFRNIIIKELRDRGIIYSYNIGVYKAYKNRIPYTFHKDSLIEKNLLGYVADSGLDVTYYNTSLFNQFCSLQSTTNYLMVGVESFAVNYLQDKMEKDKKKVVTSNDLARLKRIFGVNIDFDYVIKKINMDTPLTHDDNSSFLYPKIETLLVDLVSDKVLSELYTSEIDNIFRNVFSRYAIKINTLLRYAKKKGVEDHIRYILLMIRFNIEKGEFDD